MMTRSGSADAGPGQSAGHLDAVEPRHPDVDQADVGAQSAGQVDRLDAVGGLGDHGDVGLVLQDEPQPAADHRLVVGEQHADASSGFRPGTGRVARTDQPPSGRGAGVAACRRGPRRVRACRRGRTRRGAWSRVAPGGASSVTSTVTTGRSWATATVTPRARGGVAGHVGQRLLDDPVDGAGHLGRPGRVLVGQPEPYGGAAAGEALDEVGEPLGARR